jgi:hypothetical protein
MLRNRMLLGACAVCFAIPAALRAQQPNVDPIPVGNVAERLGVKLMPSAPIELDLGHSATATLADPGKIEAVGIKGMHEGARVTITCVGPSRLRVEADEMSPVEQRKTITVRVDSDGTLTQTPDRPPPAKPPVK